MLKDELPTDRGLYCTPDVTILKWTHIRIWCHFNMLQYGSYYLVYILTEWDEGAYRRLLLGVVTVDACQYAHLSSSVRKS